MGGIIYTAGSGERGSGEMNKQRCFGSLLIELVQLLDQIFREKQCYLHRMQWENIIVGEKDDKLRGEKVVF